MDAAIVRRVPNPRPIGLPLLALLAALLGAGAPLADALEPGVHIDPRSPAAKEYALPLEQARRTGAGGSPGEGSQGEAGLFGAGIRPHGGDHGAHGTGSRQAASRKGGAAGDALSRRMRAHSRSAMGGPPQTATNGSGGDDSLLALLAGGVAVLVVGALAGTILRRRPKASARGG